MKDFLIDRLKEPSTWLGLFAVGSAFFGMELDQAQKDAVMMLSIALLGGSSMISKG